ncbi:hypothetical protein BIV57_19360 [Mangrovactinospora gilvigrisea]|uniref:Uncharacterized protein n=1 Tax=Mangrovactinospora gilvigrisea TaxID=1428644 RepID=A0A1J7C2S9_9ACTN|nr:hypothetical protein BIV57_19360 [Mangrovactinospora gilvigrisea]
MRGVCLGWTRLQAEWTGSAEAWAAFTAPLLARRTGDAERRHARKARRNARRRIRRPRPMAKHPAAELPLRHYRGLAPAQVDALARRQGWTVAWDRSRLPRQSLTFVPAHLPDLPAPADPAAAR